MAEAEQVPGQPEFTWKQKLLAAFVTWHLVAVIFYVLPYPPYFDEATLNRPESKEELHILFSSLKPFAPWWDTQEEMQTKVLAATRAYMDGYFEVRKVFEPYLEATGSTQTWNLFAGTPPKYPMVFMVDVYPDHGTNWVPFQDMNWGTRDFEALHFRHFEVMGNLAAPGWEAHRQWYANYWARRWNQLHPNTPARWVRFYYLRLTTPSAAQVRAGDSDRRPMRVQEWMWQVPPDPKR
ncbi:MAG TPA: hypothetical protein VK524_26170 [Polyangiaceae bacterium]|nr:hypothetical protein [Polyangiaceae bacterium]